METTGLTMLVLLVQLVFMSLGLLLLLAVAFPHDRRNKLCYWLVWCSSCMQICSNIKLV